MENIESKINKESASEIVPSSLAKRLLEIIPNKSGNEILEIGAKEGNLKGEHSGDDCVFLAKEGNKVTLVERGEGILKKIYAKAESKQVDSSIDFIDGNPEKLDLPDGKFDAAFSLSGLDGTLLPDSFKEVSRVLKQNAKALVFIYFKSGGKFIQGPEEKLDEYITQSNLQIDSKFIKVIDGEKGLEAIIYELHK